MRGELASSHSSFWELLPRPIIVLAPMDEVTDVVFRDIVHQAGPPMVYVSEFVHAAAIVRGEGEALRRLEFNERHRPMVAQIWGNDPEEYFAAAGLIHRLGFDGIDINMGCPVRKLTVKGACSALINRPALAAELITATREGAEAAFAEYGDEHEGPPGRVQSAARLPISVKTRLGFQDIQTERWASFLLEQNIDLLTIHGRTSVQQSEGIANWQEIARAVELRNAISPSTLLFGNGDVKEFAQFENYARSYKVDGIMVGRGLLENLFIFNNARFHDLLPREQLGWALKHLLEYRRVYEGRRNFEIMKKFFKIYLTHFPGAQRLRDHIMDVHDYDDAEQVLREFQDKK